MVLLGLSFVLATARPARAQGGFIQATPNPYEIEDTISTDYYGSWQPFDPECQWLYGYAEACYAYFGYTYGETSWGGGAGYGDYLGYGQGWHVWNLNDGQGSFYPSVTYTGTLTVWYWDSFWGESYTTGGYYSPTTAQQTSSSTPVPDYEQTGHINNEANGSHFGGFVVRNPFYLFNGRLVREFDAPGSYDSCHFPMSEHAPYLNLTGGTWEIRTTPGGVGNHWWPDTLAWDGNQIRYYRDEGRAPCAAALGQEMRINMPGGGWHPYSSTILHLTIFQTELANERQGVHSGVFQWP